MHTKRNAKWLPKSGKLTAKKKRHGGREERENIQQTNTF